MSHNPQHNPAFKYKNKISYDETRKLPFQIYFKKIGFPRICADWCETNCIGKYGWYFDPKGGGPINVYVGFESGDDALYFTLKWIE